VLEFRDRVVKMSLAFNHLVVATTSQCAVYRCGSWSSPHVFDLKESGSVSVLSQSPKYILLVDAQNGLQVSFSSMCTVLLNPTGV
jgi:intraflagellar transport protein 80